MCKCIAGQVVCWYTRYDLTKPAQVLIIRIIFSIRSCCSCAWNLLVFIIIVALIVAVAVGLGIYFGVYNDPDPETNSALHKAVNATADKIKEHLG